MYSIPTTQPTVDLSSYVEQRGIIVLVQWFGTTVAVEAVVCTRIHVVSVIVKYNTWGTEKKKENYSKTQMKPWKIENY
jgi:hypothetical protein